MSGFSPRCAARETRWRDTGLLGLYCDFEGKRPSSGAGVERETTKPAEAYARFPGSSRTRYRDGLLQEL